ncbi:hypothetical protein VO63_20370 [Streptomyces showdoensis]|uniref:Uncharacterized protein n=2 Tax=Streptomyces showdoensis TaxID=68268 RepID=A0A2P2GKU8_STREW|nr:hypothetical protein VO63_20370 [Streptomyces showdoensis]
MEATIYWGVPAPREGPAALNMPMDIVEGGIAAVAAAFSGWAAYSAMKAADAADDNSKVANQTAELARQTAEAVAQIERDRWHKELTPRIVCRLTQERGMLELVVAYEGPTTLGKLSVVSLTIRDDRDRSTAPALGGGLPLEEVKATIWGPYRFTSRTPEDNTGRTATPFSVEPGDEMRFSVTPTFPHRLYGGDGNTAQWRAEFLPKDFRLWVGCEAEGHKPWKLMADVPHEDGVSRDPAGVLAS